MAGKVMTMAMAQLLKRILTTKGGKLANIRDMGAYHQRIVRRYGGTGPAYRRANNIIRKAKNERDFDKAISGANDRMIKEYAKKGIG